MDAGVFWDGLYAVRDLWRHDKPGLAWGLGLGLLLIWATLALVGASGWQQTAGPVIGVPGAVMFSSGLAVWVAFIPRRRRQFRRPDR